MDDEIEQALQSGKQKKPSKKVQKESEEEADNDEEGKKVGIYGAFVTKEGLRKDLKKILLKNPQLDFQQNPELEEFVNSLDEESLVKTIEDARFQLGLQKPNANGKAFLGIIGDLSDRMFSTKLLGQKLLADNELVEMMDEIIPSDITWMSAPFRIINRILYHIQMDK